jgi:uncharacterized protein (TIGR01777 family)
MPIFERVTEVEASAVDLFRYHAAADAFSRLTPPWDDVVIVRPLARLADGEVAEFRVGVGPLKTRWVARHEHVADGTDGGVAGFDDVMVRGPASSWRHEHRFEPLAGGRALLRDRITWSTAPGGGLVVAPMLERMFRFRHRRTSLDLALDRALMALPGGERRRVVGVSGASGLIGREVCSLLRVLGHEVRPLVRVATAEAATSSKTGSIAWHPASGAIDAVAAGGLDAMVHLAGENIADGRLTAAKQARLRRQRVDDTVALWRSLAKLSAPPSVVVGAAAVGIFGDRGDEPLDEASGPGRGPLSAFCVDWESAILAATTMLPATRAVALRIGIVQSPRGGALGKVLPVFRAGLGGPLGNGRAFVPWIAVDDMADVIVRAIIDARVAGAVNAVAPTPVTQRDYARALGAALHRPAIVPVPRFALNAVLGADLGEHVVESMRASPAKLLHLGHRFRHATIDDAFAHLLGVDGARA